MLSDTNSQQSNNKLVTNLEELIKQNDVLINNVNLLTERLKTSNNTDFLEKFILYVSNNPFYTEIDPLKHIIIEVPRGNTLYKYFNVYNNDILKVTIDDIQVNTKGNFWGFINDRCLYLTIPNLLNNNKINLLKIGDETIQIYHNFIPKIDLVQVFNISNNNMVYINIYGENLFSFSKVYISYLENNYNVFVKDFTTNDDYTCIKCSYYIDPKIETMRSHKVYIINYDLSSKSYMFEVQNITNIFNEDN